MAQPKITVSQVETTEIAPIASPAFTGIPTGPTPAALDNTTKLATTAYVQTELSTGSTSVAAWVNFDGSGVVAINDSENVTSITDNGVGNYTANFTNNMANVNYALVYGSNRSGNDNDIRESGRLVSSCSVHNGTWSNQGGDTFSDASNVSIVVFGDLA